MSSLLKISVFTQRVLIFSKGRDSDNETGSSWLRGKMLDAPSVQHLWLPASRAAEQPNDVIRRTGFVHGAGQASDLLDLPSVTEE